MKLNLNTEPAVLTNATAGLIKAAAVFVAAIGIQVPDQSIDQLVDLSGGAIAVLLFAVDTFQGFFIRKRAYSPETVNQLKEAYGLDPNDMETN